MKDKYKKRAKAMKSGSYAGKDIQCDSMGNSLKLIRSAEKDKQQKFDEMIAYIKEFVETNGAVGMNEFFHFLKLLITVRNSLFCIICFEYVIYVKFRDL